MKKFILFSFLFLSFIGLSAQCKPIFRLMPKQPAPTPSGFFSNENYNFKGNELSVTAIKSKSDTTGLRDTIIINHWKDTSWLSYPKVFLKEYSFYNLLRWNNRVFIAGNYKQYNNNAAPLSYRYTILELKNGIWDSLPGCLVSDSNYNYVSYAANSNGLYKMDYKLVRNSFNQYFHYAGKISIYDTTSTSFDSVANFISYGRLILKAGDNRLLIAGVDTINGLRTEGFAYIDGSTINRNTDKKFSSNSEYYIDKTDDHVYTISYSTTPIILEYSTSLVSSRQTTSIPNSATGGTGVFDGKIVYVSYDIDNNQYVNVLCRNQTNWNTIINQVGLKGTTNLNFTNSGFYFYNYSQRKVMMLDEGSLIKGQAFIDLDSNCVLDTITEPYLKYKLVNATSTDYKISALTDNKGHFELFVPPGIYELSGPSIKTSCGPDSVVVTSNGTTSTQNLPLLRPGYFDIRAKLLNGFLTRWNSTNTYHALIENLGEPVDSAYIEFNVDGKLDITSADAAITNISGNKASGQLKNMGFFEMRLVSLATWVDTATTKPDSVVCTSLHTHLYQSEKDSLNNDDTICQRVVYSYDPNHKSCNKDTIPFNTASKLDYMIEFQNEGNDDAYDVVITDQLSSSLNLETFKIIGASHPYSYTLNGSLLTITFKNIYLKPKKTDEKLSQGYFKYSISTKTGLTNNTKIRNTAFIYFDLNKAVVTNTSIVVVYDGSFNSSINKNLLKQNSSLKAYPNPTKGLLNIESSLNEDIHIYSIEGKEMMLVKPENGLATVDINKWPTGIYIIRCGNTYCKLVKESEN